LGWGFGGVGGVEKKKPPSRICRVSPVEKHEDVAGPGTAFFPVPPRPSRVGVGWVPRCPTPGGGPHPLGPCGGGYFGFLVGSVLGGWGGCGVFFCGWGFFLFLLGVGGSPGQARRPRHFDGPNRGARRTREPGALVIVRPDPRVFGPPRVPPGPRSTLAQSASDNVTSAARGCARKISAVPACRESSRRADHGYPPPPPPNPPPLAGHTCGGVWAVPPRAPAGGQAPTAPKSPPAVSLDRFGWLIDETPGWGVGGGARFRCSSCPHVTR